MGRLGQLRKDGYQFLNTDTIPLYEKKKDIPEDSLLSSGTK